MVQWQVSRAVAVLSLCAATHLDSLQCDYMQKFRALSFETLINFYAFNFRGLPDPQKDFRTNFRTKKFSTNFPIYGIHYMNIE